MTDLETGATPTPASSLTNRMVIAVLSLVGIFLAFFLVAHNFGWAPPLQCGVGDCGTVQSSKYAWIGPVPVSGIGLGGYAALFGLSILGLQPERIHSRWIPTLLVLGSLIGFVFSSYLTYLEARVINAWCQYCVASAIIISLIFIATLPEIGRIRRKSGTG